ncbi:MAG: tyrosine-type recombinase/integrase [Gammaproteobacteria bacterium]|nr:tyrosine-type recombinase/integrase [Gammaproteobacteria bacterium]
MPKLLLTDLSVRTLKCPEKGQIIYWDDRLSGFGCRVSQGGQKTFVVMYGPREARRRKVVGRYPLHGLKQARELAKKTLAEISLGIIAEPKRGDITFAAARTKYIDQAKSRVSRRTAADYDRLLSKHFAFGKKKLNELRRDDIVCCLNKLNSTPSEQAHANTAIRIFCNWAYREELIDQNPVDRLPKLHKLPSRERVLSEQELAEVYREAEKYHWPFGPIVQLCILTGQRRGEIGKLQWDWINLSDNTITLPGEQVKNRQTHRFPIGKTTVGILDSLPRIDEYVFSGRNKGNTTFNGWAKSKRDFDATLENVSSYTLHDLRRTFSTIHARLGTPVYVTEKLLNHASGAISGVAAIYNRHSYLEEMREAVDRFEKFVKALQRE